jgi:hypothetical protein
MDSDDHEDEERAQDTNFFTSREYKSKTDIKDAVIEQFQSSRDME